MEVTEGRVSASEERDERLSRRGLLRLGAMIGLGTLAALTACGEGDDDDEEDEEDD